MPRLVLPQYTVVRDTRDKDGYGWIFDTSHPAKRATSMRWYPRGNTQDRRLLDAPVRGHLRHRAQTGLRRAVGQLR